MAGSKTRKNESSNDNNKSRLYTKYPSKNSSLIKYGKENNIECWKGCFENLGLCRVACWHASGRIWLRICGQMLRMA
jgi:hypothetical protein